MRSISWPWRVVFSEDAPGILDSLQYNLLIRVVHGTRLTERTQLDRSAFVPTGLAHRGGCFLDRGSSSETSPIAGQKTARRRDHNYPYNQLPNKAAFHLRARPTVSL